MWSFVLRLAVCWHILMTTSFVTLPTSRHLSSTSRRPLHITRLLTLALLLLLMMMRMLDLMWRSLRLTSPLIFQSNIHDDSETKLQLISFNPPIPKHPQMSPHGSILSMGLRHCSLGISGTPCSKTPYKHRQPAGLPICLLAWNFFLPQTAFTKLMLSNTEWCFHSENNLAGRTTG